MTGARAGHSPWDRRDFRRWSRSARRLWLHLLTGPHRNLLGCFVLDAEQIESALRRIEEDGRILRDPDAHLVLVRGWLAYRPLAPGDRKPAARLADALPRSAPVLRALRRELTSHGGEPGRLAERVLADRLEGEGNEEFPWRRRRRVPTEMRRRVRRRDDGRCVRCGSTEELTVDHVHPFSRGGLTVPRNLQLLCKPCNSSKSAHTMEEWAQSE